MFVIVIIRRNEHYLGIKQQGQMSTGDDPKRFAVAMTEYSKEKVFYIIL